MSLVIEMSAEEIEAIKQLTRLENDNEAVVQAAREFLRLGRFNQQGNRVAASGGLGPMSAPRFMSAIMFSKTLPYST